MALRGFLTGNQTEYAEIELGVTHNKLSLIHGWKGTKGCVKSIFVSFEFRTEDWNSLAKTIVFRGGETSIDVVADATNKVAVPSEMLAMDIGNAIEVSVYGSNGDGVILCSDWLQLFHIEDGADPSGDESTDPTLPIWAQILDMIGSLDELETTGKSNLVAAVNETVADISTKMDKADPVGTGTFSMNRKADTTIGKYSSTLGGGCIASGDYSHAEGQGTEASGSYSHAEGKSTLASGYNGSHAEGNYSKATWNCAHAEGSGTEASAYGAHAEGCSAVASGSYGSHAEGGSTKAEGESSHAEGYGAKALGDRSHAEGYYTVASGNMSHTEGYYTTAQGKSQHVQGEFNVLDTEGTTTSRGRYAHIVGNGESDSARSNAHTLDWDGNAWYAGDVYVGGTSQDDAARLATTDDVAKKQDIITGAVSEVLDADLTADRALVSDVNGKLAASDITATELGYLDGATGNIQKQLDGKQDSLTFDDTPTENSANPVTSGGIFEALKTAGGGISTDGAEKWQVPIADGEGNYAWGGVVNPNIRMQTYTYEGLISGTTATRSLYIEEGYLNQYPDDASEDIILAFRQLMIITMGYTTISLSKINDPEYVWPLIEAGLMSQNFTARTAIHGGIYLNVKYPQRISGADMVYTYKCVDTGNAQGFYARAYYNPADKTYYNYGAFGNPISAYTSYRDKDPSVPQFLMSAAPTQDMHVATKKYVDDLQPTEDEGLELLAETDTLTPTAQDGVIYTDGTNVLVY